MSIIFKLSAAINPSGNATKKWGNEETAVTGNRSFVNVYLDIQSRGSVVVIQKTRIDGKTTRNTKGLEKYEAETTKTNNYLKKVQNCFKPERKMNFCGSILIEQQNFNERRCNEQRASDMIIKGSNSFHPCWINPVFPNTISVQTSIVSPNKFYITTLIKKSCFSQCCNVAIHSSFVSTHRKWLFCLSRLRCALIRQIIRHRDEVSF